MKNDFVLFLRSIEINPKNWFKFIFWTSLILGLGWVINLIWYKPYSIELFYERIFLQESLEHPQEMSKHGLYEQYWLKKHNRRLNSVSQDQTIKDFEFLLKQFDMLVSYKRNKQSKEQLLSTDILSYSLEDVVLKQQFSFYEYPIDHINGIHVQLPLFMLEVHQINTFQDADNYINRLSLFEKQFKEMEERISMAASSGTVPPLHLVKQMESEINTFLQDEVLSNLLYNDFQKKVKKLNYLPQVSLGEFNYNLKLQVENNVIAAYEQLGLSIAELENYANEENIGVYRYDEGITYYAVMLKHHITVPFDAIFVSLTTDSLSRMAEQEIAEIKKEEARLLFKMGYQPDLRIRTVFTALENNDSYFYREDSLGQKDLINDLNLLLYDVENDGKKFFNIMPKFDIVCKAMPDLMSSFPLTYYYSSDLIGERNASLYINMSDMKSIPKFSFKNLIIENIWPGLHLQQSEQRANNLLPSFRRDLKFTAYTEGWKHYAKKLAYANGMFKTDLEKLTKIQSDLLSAAKMIVDLNLHTNNWDYTTAVNYLIETSGINESRAKKEVDWIIIEPGRACAYLVGYQNLNTQIQRAKNALGSNFNLDELHSFILTSGPVPHRILSTLVDDFIRQNQ